MNHTDEIARLRAEADLLEQTQRAYNAYHTDPNTRIQSKMKGTTEWKNNTNPKWGSDFHYRIAPSPVLRPWTPAEAIGRVVKQKDAEIYRVIVYADPLWVKFSDHSSPIAYEYIKTHYQQPDGSPCGVEVEG